MVKDDEYDSSSNDINVDDNDRDVLSVPHQYIKFREAIFRIYREGAGDGKRVEQ